MTTAMFVLMMQFVISTRAGLVNYVQGDVNVKAMQSVEGGESIKTGRDGLAEVLLNPGSFLRLDRNSEVVLDGIELTNIAVRIVSGTAVIEAVDFNKESPLKVTNGNLAIEIIKDGIYKFSDGKVTIVAGKIQTADNKIAFSKGWELSKDQTYRAAKIPKGAISPLENWSRSRSELIAQANVNVANSLRRSPNLSVTSWNNAWMFVPGFGAYIFMPGYHFRSPYGYHYRTFIDQGGYYGGGPNSESGGGSGGSVSNSGGGNGGGGGSAAPSVPIQSRPIAPQIGVDRPSPSLGKPGL